MKSRPWVRSKNVILHFSIYSTPIFLSKQFEMLFEKQIKKNGCSQFKWPKLTPVKVSVLEQFNTTEEKLRAASHVEGAGCQCSQCLQLKKMEEKWICWMGTYHGEFGQTKQYEISNKARANFLRDHGGNSSSQWKNCWPANYQGWGIQRKPLVCLLTNYIYIYIYIFYAAF